MLYGAHEFGVVVLDLIHPILVHVPFPRPAVLKLAASPPEFVGGHVKVPVFVERRIRRDQVDGFRIHRTHHVEVFAMEQRAVLPVGPIANLLCGGGCLDMCFSSVTAPSASLYFGACGCLTLAASIEGDCKSQPSFNIG